MNFSTLSNASLVSCFENFVASERKITAQVLDCISEIDQRKIYFEKGHTSLFDYLVKDVGYSPGAAMRRIDGARLIKELPELTQKFEEGSITLSQATQIQRASRDFKKAKKEFISTDQKRALVLQIENSSQKETEQTLAVALDLPVPSLQKETLHRDQSVTLTITFTAEQMQVLEQTQNMIAHSVTSHNWADMLTYLAKKEISRRTVTRGAPQGPTGLNLRETTRTKPQTAVTAVKNQQRPALPAKARKTLLHEKATCAHKNKNGRPCLNRRFLQIDHIKSWSRGGAHSLENLQVLCGVHNRLKYDLEKGLFKRCES